MSILMFPLGVGETLACWVLTYLVAHAVWVLSLLTQQFLGQALVSVPFTSWSYWMVNYKFWIQIDLTHPFSSPCRLPWWTVPCTHSHLPVPEECLSCCHLPSWIRSALCSNPGSHHTLQAFNQLILWLIDHGHHGDKISTALFNEDNHPCPQSQWGARP